MKKTYKMSYRVLAIIGTALIIAATACKASKKPDNDPSQPAANNDNSNGTAQVSRLADAPAGDYLHYKGRPGSKVRIDGSANIHDWSMESTIVPGEFDVPANVKLDSTQAGISGLSGDKLNAQAHLSIPVDSFQSGTQGMDAVMQEAMDAKDHPRIEYKLSEMTFKQPHAAGTPLQFDTKGDLTINGITKAVAMPVNIETLDKGKLKITGGPVAVLMTDFKVPPPTKAGIFTTHPDVKITFEWVVGLPKQAAK